MPDRPENSIVPAVSMHDPVVYAEPAYPYQPAPEPPPNIFRTIHGSLRGRYLIVGILSFVAMAAGAVGGFLSGHLLYRSEALVHVEQRLPYILKESDQTSLLPNFSSFVNTQASLIKHDRVITRAVNSEEWLKLGRTNSPAAIQTFRRSLWAANTREMPEFISVSFTDDDPKVALVGLEQALRAYEEIFGAESNKVTNFTRRELENRRLDLQSKLATIRQQIRQAEEEYGTEDLAPLQAQKMQQALEVDRKISELALQLAERVPAPGVPANPDKPTTPPPHITATPEQIALSDATMAQYLTQRNELEQTLESLKAQGFGDKHPEIARVNSRLDPLLRLIANHTSRWNEARRGMIALPDPGIGGVALETTEHLQAKLARLQAQLQERQKEAVTLGNKALDIKAFMRDEGEILAKLKEANDRLDEINVESKVEQNMSRIAVLYPESAPSIPTVDTRKKYALLGAAGGFCGVTGLAFLLGLIDRRCRYSDELEQTTASDAKLLACLPVMGARADPESLAVAAHCIHRIRVRLEIVSPDHRTIAITSASPGDGKTSMAMSLGISYAGVGRRTLLIDLDIVGRGLSSRMGLNDATDLAEALAKGTPEGFARPSHIANMDVLAIGPRSHASPSRLRSETVRRLLQNAARLYDTVVVDTGPLLGSLEANFACSVADAVLLVVGRGQSRSLVKRAVKQLQEINARLAGIVFNRARSADFRASTMSASIRSVRPHVAHPNGHRPADSGIDPLADAVLVDSFSEDDDPDAATRPA